jgi:hypothetical protein
VTNQPRQIRLRYPALCSRCEAQLAAGVEAWWDSDRKQALCLDHPLVADPVSTEVPELALGVAGASAQREFERRRTRREDRIRAAHPRLGGLILALSGEPQSTQAWATGADGERALGERLDEIAAGGAVALHDRRIPGTRANIDHIVVAPAGVFVIDAKKYAGKVEKRDVGGLFKKDERLYVGRRDCSKLVEGMRNQVGVVRAVLASRDEGAEVPVTGALCFVGAEWPFFARPMQFADVVVAWPKRIASMFDKEVALSPEQVAMLGKVLAERLVPA